MMDINAETIFGRKHKTVHVGHIYLPVVKAEIGHFNVEEFDPHIADSKFDSMIHMYAS